MMKIEYMALSDAAREILARRQLFEELHIPSASKPVTILIDNQTAFNISENPANYRRESHITARIIYSDIYKRFFLPQCALSTYIYSIFFFQKTLRMLNGII